MKLLISGGHLTPALAFIDHIQKEHPQHTVVFAGRVYSQPSTKQKAKEQSEVEKRNCTFIPFDSGKLSQTSYSAFPLTLLHILKAFFSALALITRHKPDVYLSFGTYMSVPLALASWILRIPIIVHEQTRSAGFANVFVSRFAQTVAVTYPETKKLFSHKNVVVTGNPIRESVLLVSKEKPDWMTIKSSDPLIFISGGSQGSEVINTMISRCASVLLKKYSIIHQCGAKNDARNYKEELEAAKEKLSLNSQKKYLVREWISETELAWIYSNAHIAISRAGANTVQELSLRHIPTLYIPLPFAHNNEQFLNAKALVDAEEALLLQQKDLTPEELTATIETLTKKHDLFKRNLQASFPSKESGSPQLYKEVIRLVQP